MKEERAQLEALRELKRRKRRKKEKYKSYNNICQCHENVRLGS